MSNEPTNFEDILKSLENEVERLESGDLSLEEALASFEKGMNLLKKGSTALQQAEAKVEKLIAVHEENLETEPLASGHSHEA
tara:strand:+ start:382 stop:627 length:246 start_codon:yes stop_codon:yes gene_type:complete